MKRNHKEQNLEKLTQQNNIGKTKNTKTKKSITMTQKINIKNNLEILP